MGVESEPGWIAFSITKQVFFESFIEGSWFGSFVSQTKIIEASEVERC